MNEIGSFYNEGFGWICRPCESELASLASKAKPGHSRLFREGEAESKTPTLANAALAKWTDATRRVLTCPRCGITEPVEKS